MNGGGNFFTIYSSAQNFVVSSFQFSKMIKILFLLEKILCTTLPTPLRGLKNTMLMYLKSAIKRHRRYRRLKPGPKFHFSVSVSRILSATVYTVKSLIDDFLRGGGQRVKTHHGGDPPPAHFCTCPPSIDSVAIC